MGVDADGTGNLSKEQFSDAWGKLPQDFAPVTEGESITELFSVLDIDDSGALSKDEFVDGVINLALSDASLESLRHLRLLLQVKSYQRAMSVELKCLQEHVQSV